MLKPPRSKKLFAELERQGKNHIQIWRGWAHEDEVVSQWGVKDGKIQETIDIPGEKGKKGTRAFITAEQAALDQLVRDIKKKAQRGYELTKRPMKGPLSDMLDKELDEVTKATEITFDGPLPNNVAFSKPKNSVDPKKLMKLATRPKGTTGGPPLAWTVKRNGMCYLVSKDRDGNVWIQSRGKLLVENSKFPHLVKEFDQFLPRKSILLCEFYIGRGKSKKDFKGMQHIANSLTDRAHAMQKELGLVHAYVFRVPFWKGENMEASHPCTRWLQYLEDMIDGWEGQTGLADFRYIHGTAISDDSYENCVKEMEEFGYEGWVVYDCWNSLGDKHISFLGQPDRPDVCWKVKRALEDDFIAIWDPEGAGEHCTSKCRIPDFKSAQQQRKSGKCCVCGKKLKPNGTWGTGKNMRRVGTLSLYQFGADNIKRYICEVSSGLTDEQKQEIADGETFVEVAVVGYQDRGYIAQGDDSNALSHPKVISFRNDKEISECIDETV